MSLCKELTLRLNNNDEPLSKRLHLAKNAFINNDVPIQRKEDVILDWFCNNVNDVEVCSTLSDCLASDHMRVLNSNDLQTEVKINLIKVITKHLKSKKTNLECKSVLINCALNICNTGAIQQYFKTSLNDFTKLVSVILNEISTGQQLDKLLQIILVFHKNLPDKTNFLEVFTDDVLLSFCKLISNFNNDASYFSKISAVIQKILYPHSIIVEKKNKLQQFLQTGACNNEDSVILNILLKTQILYYDNEDENIIKLMFHALINTFKNKNHIVFQLLIILCNFTGLSDSIKLETRKDDLNIEQVLNIINDVLNLLYDIEINIEMKNGEMKFSDFIEKVIMKIIELTKVPTCNSLKILTTIIKLHPLAMESLLKDLIPYTMLSRKKNENVKNEYSVFMINLFKMFSKLHREPKLLSRILKCINLYLGSDLKNEDVKYKIKKLSEIELHDVLPPSVINHFGEVVETLSSSQSISVFRTLNFQLKNDITEILNISDHPKSFILLTQIESELLITFLKNVTIAEHTVASVASERFINDMNDLKLILSEFGNKLIHIEHNRDLIVAFLNICYFWGELALIIYNYTNDGNKLITISTTDISANGFTFIHNYLTVDQWKTISQRIANFGEFNCRALLQKFRIQKIRSILLINGKISTDLKTPMLKMLMTNLDETLNVVLSENVATDCIIPLLDTSQLLLFSNGFVKEIMKSSDYNKITRDDFQDQRMFMLSILVVCFDNMYKLLKIKRKHDDTNKPSFLSRKILSIINSEKLILDESTSSLMSEEISAILDQCDLPTENLYVNEDNIISFLKIIQLLPLAYFSETVQTMLVLILIALRSDLTMTCLKSTEAIDICEEIVINLLESDTPANIVKYLNYETIIKYIQNFTKFNLITNLIVENTFKNEETLPKIKDGLKYLSKNLSSIVCLQMFTVFISNIFKKKKIKNVENKKLVNKLKKKSLKLVLRFLKSKHTYEPSHLIEIYTCVLEYCFVKESEEEPKELQNYIKMYLDYSFDDSEKTIHKQNFLVVVLRFKNKFNDLPDDFILQCKKIFESSSSIMELIFEISSNEQLAGILKDLQNETETALQKNEKSVIEQKLVTWTSLINSSLNHVKDTERQNALTSFLMEVNIYLTNNKVYSNVHITLFELLLKLVENKQIPTNGCTIDLILQIISSMHFYGDNYELFHKTYSLAITLLESLFTNRIVLMLDRLPSLMSRFRYLVKVLVENSHTDKNVPTYFLSNLSDCGHKLERFVNRLVKHKKHFTRLAPYLVADILQLYEKFNIYLPVKMHLNKCVHAFIDVFDPHAIPFLSRNLSTTSNEIFKTFYNEYKKYYKFVGKI